MRYLRDLQDLDLLTGAGSALVMLPNNHMVVGPEQKEALWILPYKLHCFSIIQQNLEE